MLLLLFHFMLIKTSNEEAQELAHERSALTTIKRMYAIKMIRFQSNNIRAKFLLKL